MNTATHAQTRTLTTPEGVELRVRLAPASERGAALLVDMIVITTILIAITVVVIGFAIATRAQGLGGQLAAIVWILGFFLLRNFYFAWFECSPRAATPGKRIMKIRVAARDGGALRIEQVVTRNAVRELELYLPISFLLARGQEIQAVIILCGIVWCAIFVFFPLFNRDRLRLGDVVAGTWVLKAPGRTLAPDMASAAAAVSAAYAFRDSELDKYGIKELQILEQILRDADRQVMSTVAEAIRRKIGRRRMTGELESEFLSAYYAALRRRLEQRMLFGVRKHDKHDPR